MNKNNIPMHLNWRSYAKDSHSTNVRESVSGAPILRAYDVRKASRGCWVASIFDHEADRNSHVRETTGHLKNPHSKVSPWEFPTCIAAKEACQEHFAKWLKD